MQTKILEATATLNNKKISIINTQMDIMCDWDVELHRNSASVDVNIIVHEVSGNFMLEDRKENYKKEVNISFVTTKIPSSKNIMYLTVVCFLILF